MIIDEEKMKKEFIAEVMAQKETVIAENLKRLNEQKTEIENAIANIDKGVEDFLIAEATKKYDEQMALFQKFKVEEEQKETETQVEQQAEV